MTNPTWSIQYQHGGSPAARPAEKMEQLVFEQTFEYNLDLWEQEYRTYEPRTVWITLAHHGTVVGAIRTIVGPIEGLKFVADLERFWGMTWDEAADRHKLDPATNVIECATLSVDPTYRSKDRWWAVKALCSAFGHFTADSGATHAVQLLDPNVRKVLVFALGLPFDHFADLTPVDYHGLLLPVLSRIHEYPTIVDTSDDEFRKLYVDRDETGRGGTELPAIDLTPTSPTARHAALRASKLKSR